GLEATPSAFNIDAIPAEVNEISYPIVVERFELIPDSAGAGEFRGGHGIRRDVRLLGEEMTFSNLTDRQRFPPPGILGGEAGALGATIRNPGTDREEVLSSKGSYAAATCDVVSTRLAAGGGYGDPRRRDPERVR